jgi:Zn-dependent protease
MRPAARRAYNETMPGTDVASFIRLLTVAAIPVLFAITLHEVAHGWMARRFGDRTAEMMGRLSLNPLKHIDPIGTVVVPILMMWLGGFMFGWAKPVPVNFRALRNPDRSMVAVAAAGPAANFVMALAWALLFRVSGKIPGGPGEFLHQMSTFGLVFNVLLGTFNLLPIPPLDGGRILRGIVPKSFALRLDAIEPYGFIIVVALLASGVLNRFISPVFNMVEGLILALVGVKG